MLVISGLKAKRGRRFCSGAPGARRAGAGQRLVALDRRHQVFRLAADIADIDRRARAQQVLGVGVPLLGELRPQVRIPGAELAGWPVQRLQPLEPGGDGAGRSGRRVVDLGLEEERRVQRQAQVGAGAFHVLSDAVAAAEHPAVALAIREAEAWLPALVVRLVERPAVAVLAGQLLLGVDQREVGLAIVLFDERRGVAPAQTEVEGQVVSRLEVVGGVERGAVLQVRPRF